MSKKQLLGWVLFLFLLAGCAPSARGVRAGDESGSALDRLVLDGSELHPALVTRKVEDAARLAMALVLRENPQLSTDSAFVDVLPRVASQGRLDGGEGIRAALYALYHGETDVGLYGLEAASREDADRVEGVLRGIWAHNAGLGLARVHREGNVLVVAWSSPPSPPYWEAVNAKVVDRLRTANR